MISLVRVMALCAAGFLAVSPVFAQRRVTVKIASLVPESTDWGKALNKFSREVSQATGGEVEVIMYHGGTVGSEEDVVRKLRLNQIQGAVLTSVGMSMISPEVMTLSYPFLIQDDAELDTVLSELKPALEGKLVSTGYTVLAWSKAGWVRVFSRHPVTVPADLKKQKMASIDGAITDAFKAMGYQMIPMGVTDLLTGFNSGRIDAMVNSPVYAASYQIFTIAGQMMDFSVAPFMGGLVINQVTWNRIPERHRAAIAALGQEVERNNNAVVSRLEAAALDTMRKYGLKTNAVSAEQRQLWLDDVQAVEPALVGTVYDREIKARIEAILAAYRRSRQAAR